MKFWSTGRIGEKISFESFQPVLLQVRNRINGAIEGENYVIEIEGYDVAALADKYH